MDTKKVLQKLLKIAENQQEIIKKLAQQQMSGGTDTWMDVAPSVQSLLARLPSGKEAAVRVARVAASGDGMEVRLRVKDLMSKAGDELRQALAGKPLATADGKTVTAPDAANINIISEMG